MPDPKIIQFPGVPGVRSTLDPAPQVEGALAPPTRAADEAPAPGQAKMPLPMLSADREKAMRLIASGATFVLVALKPTPSGADFFTACDGDADDLRNAEQHMPAVIGRLLQRKGIR